MVILRHELKQGRNALIIWTAVIAGMLSICILIYPEMKSQMDEISGMLSEMGSFSAAFGMDKINFGEFMGFFGVECGNVLGLGGAFFAALLGILSLAKEEKEQTAEFLLTHPISRKTVVAQKLGAMMVQIVLLNIVSAVVVALSAFMVGETPEVKTMAILLLAYLIMQVETAAVCFGISAFLNRGGLGIGLGIAALFYFLNIVANLTENVKFLKYITPFGYTESSYIIVNGNMEVRYLAVGLVLTAAGIWAAFWKYGKKDIR